MNETPKSKLTPHAESTAAEMAEMRSRDADGQIIGPGLMYGFHPRFKAVHRFDPYREQMAHMRLAGANDQSIMDFLKSKGINLMYKEVSAYLIKHGYRLRSPRKQKPQAATAIHMEQTSHIQAASTASQTAPAVQAPGSAGGAHNEAKSANTYSNNASMGMKPFGHNTDATAAGQTAAAVQAPGIAGGGHTGSVNANETPANGGTAQPAPALAGPVHKGSAVAAPNTNATPEPREHYSTIDRMAKARDAVKAQNEHTALSVQDAAPPAAISVPLESAEDMFPLTNLVDKELDSEWSKITLMLSKYVRAKHNIDTKETYRAIAHFVAHRLNSKTLTPGMPETMAEILWRNQIDGALGTREFKLFKKG